jgi:hypothetical protein
MGFNSMTLLGFGGVALLAATSLAVADDLEATLTIDVDGTLVSLDLDGVDLDNGLFDFVGTESDPAGDWTVEWDFTVNPDPTSNAFINGDLVVTNSSGTASDVSVGFDVSVCPKIANGSQLGGVLVVDISMDGDGGAITCAGGQPIWSAMIDGTAANQQFACPFNIGGSGAGAASTNTTWGTPIPGIAGPPVTDTIGIEWNLNLTAGDAAEFSNIFVVGADPDDLDPCVPDPVSADDWLTYDLAYGHGGRKPRDVAFADLDGDSSPEMIVANGEDLLSVRFNDGSGAFGPKVQHTVGDTPMGVAADDLDGDGDVDVVVTNYKSKSVSLLDNSGSGDLAVSMQNVGKHPICVVTEDFDGDGHVDLALAQYTVHKVSVRLNQGGGVLPLADCFTTGAGYPVHDHPVDLCATDIDGDGFVDLVAACKDAKYLSLLMNNGDGTFAPAEQLLVGKNTFGVASGDLDGDGNQDLVLANSAIDKVKVRLGNGDGTFVTMPSCTVGEGPRSVALVDLDGDGELDLVCCNADSNDLSVRPGNGDGTFGDEPYFAVGSLPTHLDVADLDGDGAPDVGTVDRVTKKISVLLNSVP